MARSWPVPATRRRRHSSIHERAPSTRWGYRRRTLDRHHAGPSRRSVRPAFRLVIVPTGSRHSADSVQPDRPSSGRFAWGEVYVCSVVPSIRRGAARLKDNGAPPFFPAIWPQFFINNRVAAPEKIVTPIAAGAVALRSLTRPAPHRAASSPFHSSGGDDDVLRTYQRTAGGALGEHQREGNPANPARTQRRADEAGARPGEIRYRRPIGLTAQSISGGGAHRVPLPPRSGQCRDRLATGNLRRGSRRDGNAALQPSGRRGWEAVRGEFGDRQDRKVREAARRDKKGAGQRRLCGCIDKEISSGTLLCCLAPFVATPAFPSFSRLAPRDRGRL